MHLVLLLLHDVIRMVWGFMGVTLVGWIPGSIKCVSKEHDLMCYIHTV